MNNKIFSRYILLVFIVLFGLNACDEDPNDAEYGFPLIYMPQASLYNGGLSNDYPVPGPILLSPNFTIDSLNNKVDIVLGVYRAGLQALEAFSVDVYVNADTLNSLMDNAVYENASILPNDVFTIPSSVSVETGERENIFFLVLDKNKLEADYPDLKGKTLFTAIGIDNPSKYELNTALSTTIVLVDSSIAFTE